MEPLSDSDYKELFHQSPFALLLCSKAEMTNENGEKKFSGGELVEFNKAFADIIGYSMDETRKTSFLKLTPEKYKDAEAEQLESLVKHKKYGPYEKEYIHKSGALVPIRLSGQIVSIGSTEYIWSIIQVISPAELEVFNKAPYGILLYRVNDGQIVAANHAFADKLGYTVEEVRKRKTFHLTPRVDWQHDGERVQRLVNGTSVELHPKKFIAKEAVAGRENDVFEALVFGRPMNVRGDVCIWELVDWGKKIKVVLDPIDPFEDPGKSGEHAAALI
jgi:PAS domain S-box-containing protein